MEAAALKFLVLGGPLFYDLCLFNPRAFQSVTTLTVMRHRDDSRAMFVHDLVQCLMALPGLQSLYLLGVIFKISDEEIEESSLELHLFALVLHSIPSDAIGKLCHAIDPLHSYIGSLEINRCAISGDQIPLLNAAHLLLTEFPADADILAVLKHWHGALLTIKNCPSFTDDVLSSMSCPGENGQWPCPFMTHFTVISCSGCSSSAIRRTVETRRRGYMNAGATTTSDPKFRVNEVLSSTVSGCDELWLDDVVWLDANVAVVEYDGWVAGFDNEESYLPIRGHVPASHRSYRSKMLGVDLSRRVLDELASGKTGITFERYMEEFCGSVE
ncbi:hypothetical protein WOLCODRAFT_15934 [Wolfiporia cocos MD-104 SS10]|uniref:Uncharacterized protein n=1 Tax=Wolfiporia cocos (strain MD-104) TaxID=742152 RepID=A0A2H3JAE2_WOLCO|nr:hypothetical protein WOLCODRAFT_15934 [Wolfiporia cocos MD-104 SS10]